MTSVVLLTGCPESSGLGGDRDASISLLPATKSFTMTKEDPKKLQMVIVADPTASMIETQQAMTQYFPGFTQGLLNTGFVFEIFCSTTSYTGTTFGEIIAIKSDSIKSVSELQKTLSDCVNTALTDTEVGDERGLEAAKQTWSKIIENGRLDPNAVKLTLIVTNEDDCSRDLGKFPSDENVFNRCIDQNVTNSPYEALKGLGAFPVTDNGYDDLEGMYPEKIRGLTQPIELFPTTRYSNFFKNELNYETRGKKDSLDEILRQRGHIFAPVIMQPPAAIGKDAAYSCKDIKQERSKSIPNAGKVMSFGMRYFKVAEESGNPTYSLCDKLEKVFQEVNTSVQNEVEIKRFILSRKPLNPLNLQIAIQRKISDVEKAQTYLDIMNSENSKAAEDNRWKLVKSSNKTQNKMKIETQIWERVLSHGQGFVYNNETNEVIFDNNLYEPYNDKLKVVNYQPAGLDGETNYEL